MMRVYVCTSFILCVMYTNDALMDIYFTSALCILYILHEYLVTLYMYFTYILCVYVYYCYTECAGGDHRPRPRQDALAQE